MNRSVMETILGALVLLIAGTFLYFAYQKSDIVPSSAGYQINASFTKVDGLKEGNDVRISGVKVGQVIGLELNPNSYMATAVLNIDNRIKIPKDTIAQAANENLLGGRFISLEIGAEEENIQPGGKIGFTQAAPNLEQLLGQAIFSATSKPDDSKQSTSP